MKKSNKDKHPRLFAYVLGEVLGAMAFAVIMVGVLFTVLLLTPGPEDITPEAAQEWQIGGRSDD